MLVYAIGFSNFQCTLLLVVSVEVVPLGSLEGAIDNAVSTVVVAFVAVVFLQYQYTLLPPPPTRTSGGFFQKVRKENTVYFTCRALTYCTSKN